MFCSIVLQSASPSYSGGNHLSAQYTRCICPSLRSFPLRRLPYQIWVSRSRGLPRSTPTVSGRTPSLWHFQGIRTISNDLGAFPAVSPVKTELPWLIVWPGTNTTGISACASMDFPLCPKRHSDYPNAIEGIPDRCIL